MLAAKTLGSGAGRAGAGDLHAGPRLAAFDRADAEGRSRGYAGDRRPGAANAALLAIEILANGDAELRGRLKAWREGRMREVLAEELPQ